MTRTTASPSVVIITHHHGPRVVLRLHGELDVSNRYALRRALHAIVEQDPQALEVDLSGLSFADCSILSVLVSAHRRLAERNHELIIAGARPIVRRLLAITGLETFFRLSETVMHEPDLRAVTAADPGTAMVGSPPDQDSS